MAKENSGPNIAMVRIGFGKHQYFHLDLSPEGFLEDFINKPLPEIYERFGAVGSAGIYRFFRPVETLLTPTYVRVKSFPAGDDFRILDHYGNWYNPTGHHDEVFTAIPFVICYEDLYFVATGISAPFHTDNFQPSVTDVVGNQVKLDSPERFIKFTKCETKIIEGHTLYIPHYDLPSYYLVGRSHLVDPSNISLAGDFAPDWTQWFAGNNDESFPPSNN